MGSTCTEAVGNGSVRFSVGNRGFPPPQGRECDRDEMISTTVADCQILLLIQSLQTRAAS
jgi:hypothetical protein